MNMRQHAILTKKLVDLSGGVKIAADIVRLSPSKVYAAMDAQDKYALTGPRITALEDYVGDPIYSRAMQEACGLGGGVVDLTREAMDATVLVARLQRDVHIAEEDNSISPRERQALTEQIQQIKQTLSRIEADLNPTELRAVT